MTDDRGGKPFGNELRHVPRERLPVWGRRWFAHCLARGPSVFETRTFEVTPRGMVQVGQACSSPSQFDMVTRGTGQEGRVSSPSPIHYPHPSASLPVQTYATELTLSSSSTSQVVDYSSVRRHQCDYMSSMSQGQPVIMPTPIRWMSQGQNAVGPLGAMPPLYGWSELSPSAHHHISPVHRGLAPLEHVGTFLYTNPPAPGPHSSHESHIMNRQLQKFSLPDTFASEFVPTQTQSLTQPPQLNSFPYSENTYHPHPDNGMGFFPTPIQCSAQHFTAPSPQQLGSSSWPSQFEVPLIPPNLSFQNPTMEQWPLGSGSLIQEPFRAAGPASDIVNEEFNRFFPGPSGHPSLEESLDTFAQDPTDESILPSDTTQGGGQSPQIIG